MRCGFFATVLWLFHVGHVWGLFHESVHNHHSSLHGTHDVESVTLQQQKDNQTDTVQESIDIDGLSGEMLWQHLPLYDSLEDLTSDAIDVNGRLRDHLLVFDGPRCASILDDVDAPMRYLARVTGNLAAQIFTIPAEPVNTVETLSETLESMKDMIPSIDATQAPIPPVMKLSEMSWDAILEKLPDKSIEQAREHYAMVAQEATDLITDEEMYRETHPLVGYLNDVGCQVACLERGTPRAQLLTPLEGQVSSFVLPRPSLQDLPDWIYSSCQQIEIGVLSFHPRPLVVRWRSGEEEPNHVDGWSVMGVVHPGHENVLWLTSFLGEEFEISEAPPAGISLGSPPPKSAILLSFTVQFNAVYRVGSPTSQLNPYLNVSTAIQQTIRREWEKRNVVKRTFSPLGFTPSKLPDDVFGSMSAYYHNNALQAAPELWRPNDMRINWWEAEVNMLPLPVGLRVSSLRFTMIMMKDY